MFFIFALWVGLAHAQDLQQAFGSVAAGSLSSPTLMPPEGPGFVKILRSRERYYGTRETIASIMRAAAELRALYPEGERLQIGDISDFDGGPITRHRSHQNGLDADIVYLRRNHREQDPDPIDGLHESFVERGRVLWNFDRERNWALLKIFVQGGNVSRIFVDRAIKRTLCRLAHSQGELQTEEETLRRLRPLHNHHDHLHVRFRCPSSSVSCVDDVELAPGHGCEFGSRQ